jgi:hypothetical protein
MKLYEYLIIFIFIIAVAFYFDYRSNVLTQDILKSISITDSLKGRDQVIERYYTTEKTNTIKEINTIVNKWDSMPKNLDSTTYNNKLTECIEDVKIGAQMVKKAYSDCDTLIKSKQSIISSQDKTIDLLKNKKTPLFIPYAGFGVSMNKNLEIYPSINAGIGINLSRLFKK